MKNRRQLFSFLKTKNSFEKKIKSIVGFYPSNAFFYELAFIHKSVVNKENRTYSQSNERLEFLGDAVLSSVVAEELFKKFKKMNEGSLSTLRAKVVSRNSLNVVGKKMNLESLIQANVNQAAMENSLLGNALEALIGAVYLDKGFEKCKQFILLKIIEEYIQLDQLKKVEVNYKSRVLEWAQKEKKSIVFKLIEETGYGHKKNFKIALHLDGKEISTAAARSKKKAEQMAAKHFNLQIIERENGKV